MVEEEVMVRVEDVVEADMDEGVVEAMDGGVEGIDGNLKLLVAQGLSVGTINDNGVKNRMYIYVDHISRVITLNYYLDQKLCS